MNKTKKIIIVSLIIILLIVIGVHVKSVITANAIKEQQECEDWLKDNCNCIERERLKCSEGFELDVEKRMCRKETFVCPEGQVVYDENCEMKREWTNVLLGCSKYNCSGEIYEFNFYTEKWPKIN